MTIEEQYAIPSKEILKRYKDKFCNKVKGDLDIVNYIWENHGFCSYNNGLFWLVNPEDFTAVLHQFDDINPSELVFARTATGCLFTWDGEYIYHLNVHRKTRTPLGTKFGIIFEWRLCAESFLEREC